MGGRTKVPTASPVAGGRITSNYGTRTDPVNGGSAFHAGVDIAAPFGTPVTSTVSGTVIKATDSGGGYGNEIIVRAADGSTYTYGHMSSLGVSTGQTVTAGQTIGKVGSTGKSTGNHLHYEVRGADGKTVNPLTGEYAAGASPNVPPGGGSATSAPAATPSGPPLSVDDQNRLRVALDKDTGYYPNYLNGFFNVAYHIKFFMVSPETFQNGLGTIGEASASKVAESLDSAQKVVIAESGVTAGINIKSLTYDSFKQTPTRDGGNFTLTLVEPLGTSFYDVTVNAALSLGIKDFKDTPYFLELSFSGYDDMGNPVENVMINNPATSDDGTPCPDMQNQGRWFWQVIMQTVDSSITEAGSTHVISLNSSVAGGQAGQDGRAVPEMMLIKGNNIKEFLDSFKEQLEACQARRYATSKGKLFTYDFKISDNSASQLGSDPLTWSLKDDEDLFTDQSGLSIGADKKPVMQISPGTEITKVIMTLFSNTKEAQQLLKDGVVTPNDVVDGNPQARDQILMNVTSVDVNIGDYSETWGQYAKTYTFRITPEYHTTAIADRRQITESKTPTVQKDMVKKLREKGMFRKRFDYLYTGLNTEVINFDVQFKMYWGAVLPNVIGYSVSNSSVATNARFNENAINDTRKIAEEYATIEAQRNTAANDLANVINSVTGGVDVQTAITNGGSVTRAAQTISDPTKRAAIVAAANRVSSFDAPLAQARAKLFAAEGTIPDQDKNTTATGGAAKGTLYAEELTDQVDTPFELRMTQAPANTGDAAGTGMVQPYHRDRAIFGALMEQLVGEQATMMDITMEVRGDPYWIGTANIEQNPQASESAVAPFSSGGLIFLLKVSYPFNGDDTNFDGSPNFRNFDENSEDKTPYRKDQFTGFYRVTQVTNTFSDGQFTQTIKAYRHPMLQVANDLGYGSADGELSSSALNTAYGSSPGGADAGGAGASAGGSTPTGKALTTADQTRIQQTIYNQLRAKGWSDEAALTAVAEIGRENNYSPSIMFGSHTDAANGKSNFGMVSWQGSRGTAFQSYMASKGFVNSDGTLVNSDASLSAQVDFMDTEMRNSYPGVYSAVTKPGQSYSTLEPLMSNRYFGWDRAGNNIGAASAQSNMNRMGSFYNAAKSNLTRN